MKSYSLILITLISALCGINPAQAMKQKIAKNQVVIKAQMENDFFEEIQNFTEDIVQKIFTFAEETLPYKDETEEKMNRLIDIEAQLNAADDFAIIELLTEESENLKDEILSFEKSQFEYRIVFSKISSELYTAILDFQKTPDFSFCNEEKNEHAKIIFKHYLDFILEFEIEKAKVKEGHELCNVLRIYRDKLSDLIKVLDNNLYALIFHAKMLSISKHLLAVSAQEQNAIV